MSHIKHKSKAWTENMELRGLGIYFVLFFQMKQFLDSFETAQQQHWEIDLLSNLYKGLDITKMIK